MNVDIKKDDDAQNKLKDKINRLILKFCGSKIRRKNYLSTLEQVPSGKLKKKK